MANKIAVIQKKCLWLIAEADKVTTIEFLQAEALMALMQEHLDQLHAKARSRLRVSGQETSIQSKVQADCNKIAHAE